MADLSDLIARLESISSDLVDKSIDTLRESLETGDVDLVAREKQLGRARRAVDKASAILAGLS